MNKFVLFIQLKLRTMLAWAPRVCGWTIVEIKMANAMMRFVVDCVEFVKRDLSILEGLYSKNKTC